MPLVVPESASSSTLFSTVTPVEAPSTSTAVEHPRWMVSPVISSPLTSVADTLEFAIRSPAIWMFYGSAAVPVPVSGEQLKSAVVA